MKESDALWLVATQPEQINPATIGRMRTLGLMALRVEIEIAAKALILTEVRPSRLFGTRDNTPELELPTAAYPTG
jgi:hypothetical protein